MILDKAKMAHDYAIEMLKRGDPERSIAFDAWTLADAMQDEADKRLKTDVGNTDASEWQPDWSQAPDDACCWFIGGASWDIKPYWSKYIPCYKSETTQTTWQGNGMTEAPSFGYQGNWQDSLRKRPQ